MIAHARSKDLLRWQTIKPGLTPALELGRYHIGFGSTIFTPDGTKRTFYSEGQDGIIAPLDEWHSDEPIAMRLFIDKMLVEFFINGGTYCVSHQVRRENIKGDHVALTRLGGIAKLTSIETWKMRSVTPERSFCLKHNDLLPAARIMAPQIHGGRCESRTPDGRPGSLTAQRSIEPCSEVGKSQD